VIGAPIRQGQAIVGVIHLYSTDEKRVPDPDDLEFTLAVADNVAQALRNLSRQQELSENLSQSQNEVQQEISRVAASRATVLVRGESGVGKELVARAVHFASPRKLGPFVCLNCAALSESLLESELFGHERGAFTGATERKIGKFEAADKGTLMLDEIGEMSSSTQAKFLRVLEGHPFERVGGSQQIKVDVRVIAATNRDLEKAVGEGKFRRDLYFRLRVVEVVVPPLRQRTEDIVELAHYFLERFREETGRRLNGFNAAVIEQMQQYRWPGNVRELKNVIERAVVLARGDRIEVEDLTLTNLITAGDTSQMMPAPGTAEALSLAEMERRHIHATLNANDWNKSRTASILGIERSTLDRKIKRYRLVRPAAIE
jgi:Nif-specific regulatory protein